MRLLVVSHKECWRLENGGFGTTGGFPYQLAALSRLFDETRLLVPVRPAPSPPQAEILCGHNLTVAPVSEPRGRGFGRKALLLVWLLRHLPVLWREISHADVVHAAVPGDIGTLGLVVALLRRRRLFVRHCGTWQHRATTADRLLAWLLPRIARKDRPVFATGWDMQPPSPGNPNVRWIFATTLSSADLAGIRPSTPWVPGRPLALVTTARLSRSKNTEAAVRALPTIRRHRPGTTLDVLGDGEQGPMLRRLVSELALQDAVRFHGAVAHAEVLQTLACSSLFVFPTRTAEGFPKAVVEAMACGLPIVASAVSVLPWLVGQGCGVTLSEPTSEALAGAVVELTSSPEAMARAAASSRTLAQTYTLEAWCSEIGRCLDEGWGPTRRLNPVLDSAA